MIYDHYFVLQTLDDGCLLGNIPASIIVSWCAVRCVSIDQLNTMDSDKFLLDVNILPQNFISFYGKHLTITYNEVNRKPSIFHVFTVNTFVNYAIVLFENIIK